MIWRLSHRADPFARLIADRHYNRHIQPMNDNLVTMGKRINSTRIALGIGLFAVVVFGGEELRAIAYGTVATRQSTSQSSLSRPLSRRVSTIARGAAQ